MIVDEQEIQQVLQHIQDSIVRCGSEDSSNTLTGGPYTIVLKSWLERYQHVTAWLHEKSK
jgi:hypothetical protein